MKFYLVGGAVRDKLLGLPIKEQDWVVTEATPDEMIKKKFRQVGKDFPVFLHPVTNEEYALARIERKTAPGYKGFAFDTSKTVTLEEDLIRRDLTINAMALTTHGTLIDPYHGKDDLEKKILRHISPAFKEDPVRILRVARFYARYAYLGFTIAPETLALMQEMVASGEINSLVPERVWKELERALTEQHPEKFFDALQACHALPILFPELLANGRGITALANSKQINPSFLKSPQSIDNTNLSMSQLTHHFIQFIDKRAYIRFAVLLHAIPEHDNHPPTLCLNPTSCLNQLCKRYRVPHAYRELALITRKYYTNILSLENNLTEKAAEITSLLYALDYFRKEERFFLFLKTCEIIAKTHSLATPIHSILSIVAKCAEVTKSIDIKTIIQENLNGLEIATMIRQTRENKIKQYLQKSLVINKK